MINRDTGEGGAAFDDEGSPYFERYRSIINDWEAFQESIAAPLPCAGWVNPALAEQEEVFARLREDGFEVEELPWIPGAFRLPGLKSEARVGRRFEFLSGQVHLQEEVSMLPVLALDPRPGERVLDLCAAPGGKSAQIAVRLGARGTLVCNDVEANRIRALRANQERLALANLSISLSPGGRLFSGQEGIFDKVLVDVPCTCEGTARKSGGLHFRGPTDSYREALVGVQKNLLLRALTLCRPGGRVVYSTCTFAPEENELVLQRALDRFGWERVEVERVDLGAFKRAQGLDHWAGLDLPPALRAAVRVYPHLNNSGGFFLASIRRRGDAEAANALPFSGGALDCEEEQLLRSRLRGAFGLSEQALDAFRLYQSSRRAVSAINRGHLVFGGEQEIFGFPLVQSKGRFPRLSAAGAKLLGHHAELQVRLPNREAADLFFQRVPQPVKDPGWRGQAIVTFEGAPLALGIVTERAGELVLESHFPKSRMLSLQSSAFERGAT
ncbi:MAG: RsmB/NOP family class I SAM-dependent RNA methyltransferase [Myxococcota bacterium]|nr:RsmB/NOP family class I SAM-dependent RNA methyltransferase [Myxococcota bacterium]